MCGHCRPNGFGSAVCIDAVFCILRPIRNQTLEVKDIDVGVGTQE